MSFKSRPALVESSTLGAIIATLAFAACSDHASAPGDAASPTADAAVPAPDAVPGSPDADVPRAARITIVPISATGHDRLFGVAFDAQGNIYASGQVAPGTDTATDYASVIARFTPSGDLDPTFGDHGVAIRNVAVGANGELFRSLVVQSDGKVVALGAIEHAGATDARDRDLALLRLNADGSTDTGFGADGVVVLDLSTGVANGTAFVADSAWGLARYPDDRLVVSGGKVRTGATDTDFAVVRLSKDGVLDPTFATGGVFALDLVIPDSTNGDLPKHNNASPRNVTILPGTQGIVAAGYQPIPGKDTAPVVFKLTDAGALDPTFGEGGVFASAVLDEQAETYAARPQGDKFVTTGYGRATATETTDILSLRINADGTLDPTYGAAGLVRIDVGGFGDNSRNLLVLPDNRVMLSGGGRPTATDVDGFVALLTPDGQPDTSFAPAGWRTIDLGGPADFLWSVALSPDGKTAAFAGVKGVGANPTPATANDDAALYLLPL